MNNTATSAHQQPRYRSHSQNDVLNPFSHSLNSTNQVFIPFSRILPTDKHTCAILDNGAVSCWGRGYYGQLGNGGTSDKSTPTLTSSLGTGRTAGSYEKNTPAPSLTTVLCRAGDADTTDDGSTKSNHQQPGYIVSSEVTTTTVLCRAGDAEGNGATSDKTTPTLTSSLGTGRTAVALSSGLLPHLRHPRQRCCVVLGIRRLRPIG